jgi:beta-phosphoglucomutase
MIRAVIFDFDGVIADTMNDNFKAWQYAFLKYNIQIEKKAYFLLEGMGPTSIANYFLDKNSVDNTLSTEIILQKEQYYKKHNKFKVYPEIYTIFDHLEKNKILIGIVTGASRERIIGTLEKFLLDKTSILITSNDVVKTKPDPEPYQKAIDILNLSSNECLVIENAILGIKSAKAAGCMCFAIETTLDCKSLRNSDMCFKDHANLINYLIEELR